MTKPKRPTRKSLRSTQHLALFAASVATISGLFPNAHLAAQTPSANALPGSSLPAEVVAAGGLQGRTIERVEVIGNQTVPTQTILNVVRTRVGEPLEPAVVQEDYTRIYGLRRFANVVARLEATERGVAVVFIVTEQKVVRGIGFRGNESGRISTDQLAELVDIRPGQGIDNYRIALARRSIEQFYQSKNFPFAQVSVDDEALARDGQLVFVISEGTNVIIRNIDFVGAVSFSEDELKKKITARTYIWLLRPGTLVEEQLDDDISAIRQFYQSRGYFDVRVGRRVLFSADQREAQVEFLIDEGVRYRVERVSFRGNTAVNEATLRSNLRLLEGMPFDQETLGRDIKKIVDHYASTGMIYQAEGNNPDYLRINTERRFRLEAGTIELVYDIGEGKPFTVGNIEIRGNARTQQKVILRDFRLEPGKLYNATEARKGEDRLKALRFFDRIRITPIGDAPDSRDVLVEVEEAKTAILTFGAGVNSNGGISGNATYEQRNFDIARWPRSLNDILDQDALVGGGQRFRASIEPGTEVTQASVSWRDPWIFDLPYSLGVDLQLRDRRREGYKERRAGGRVTLGKRFDDVYSASLGLRVEDVRIFQFIDKPIRAFEILEAEGHTLLTSLTLTGRRDTTNLGPIAYEGTTTQVSWESFGLLGGEKTFQKLSATFDWYHTLYSDLLDRRTVLALRFETGYITGDSPFFERFYGGGLGNIRGFAFRGVSPREGPDEDPIGGEFQMLASAELGFPLYGDTLRGVVFVDAGTVESDVRLGTVRSAAGFGVRINLPLLGQLPVAIDYAVPITKDDQDDEQRISFYLGIIP
jgi:outer membrane protein insertion porin family